MNNLVFKINNEPTIIYKTDRKIIWLSLPELNPIFKYYTKSNCIQTINQTSILIIDKCTITFATIKMMPLTIAPFKVEVLDWEPLGGVCLTLSLILYDKHTINFYQRAQNLKKTWTIQVMQEITKIKSSPLEKVLGMTVNEKKNTIFLWNLDDISNKPFQQITVSDNIVKWQFQVKDMLVILTQKQFHVYFPQNNKYNLQFFIELAHITLDFCFLERPKTNEHSGRRTVYPVAILGVDGKTFIYQLYDLDKRVKNSVAYITSTLELDYNTKSILCGFEKQNSEVILCGESSNGKPFAITLNHQFTPKKKIAYQQELTTSSSDKIQYCKDIICTQQTETKTAEEIQKFILYHLQGKQEYVFLSQQLYSGYLILGGYNLFCVESEKMTIYQKCKEFKSQDKIVIQTKFPNGLLLLEEKDNNIYFVCGIRLYHLDLESRTFKAIGFTIKNDKFKLVEVRNQTRSLLYKNETEHLLLEYVAPDNPIEKITIKSIKSSINPIVYLRNNRWVQLKIDKLVLGENMKILAQFDLAKFFRILTQENTLLSYNIFWTTHDSMLLQVKNYIFILQLLQSTDGYSITPIKRSLNFLHCRLNPDLPLSEIQILDARNFVIRQGKRIIKLDNKIGNFVSEDPYSLPDTLLKRQLSMRKMYPPHHPKMIQFLIQLGYFPLLDKLFKNFKQWVQEKGTMADLFNSIGLNFFREYHDKVNQTPIPQVTNSLDSIVENPLKILCQLILQAPSCTNLQQNNSLILQSQIESLIFREQNSRSLDSYSSIILTQFKTFEAKNLHFNSMHISFMLHSINKQEALVILKYDKNEIDWEWMKKYSVVLWFDEKKQARTWAEQIGTNLFKIGKQPMDCLFWYTIAGKKNVLVQLFKKYTFNSAEHDAIFKFLQRDFSQLKNQNAAVKNAYVLIDKKRYLHALAFFIYGQKIDEALSLCLNKLKDFNLAFLICTVMEDNINRQKLLDTLKNQGDVWCKHIAYFYKNQHIDSFNCLFQQENVEALGHWVLSPELAGFHPALKQFAELIQKSIPVKRQIQEQKMKTTMTDHNDIFDSFYGGQEQSQVQQNIKEQKVLIPNYEVIKKQSVSFFIRNNCPILALMLNHQNTRAHRSYDLCEFLLTKKVNSTIIELIEQMEDYQSIIQAKALEGASIKSVLQDFNNKFRQIFLSFNLSSVVVTDKSKIGELMHYAYFSERILLKISQKQILEQQACQYAIKNIEPLLEVSKLLIILELKTYDKLEQFSESFVHFVTNSDQNQPERQESNEFWQSLKLAFDRTPEIKKNKKQNLYDSFEQVLNKYTYKKSQMTAQNFQLTLTLQDCIPIFLNQIFIQSAINLLNEKIIHVNSEAVLILQKEQRLLKSTLIRWSQQQVRQEVNKQFNILLRQGVVSKLKLHFLPQFLGQNFEYFCRSVLLMKSKTRKTTGQKQVGKLINTKNEKINRNDVIQIFRNRQELPKCLAINKNDGFGMEIGMLTKRGVKKLQICESLANRNRSQDGTMLLHEDSNYSMDGNYFNFDKLFETSHPPLIDKFLHKILENRREYDGSGIIKGSTKRTTPQYLRSLQNSPYLQFSEINCMECHHFLPIYILGSKSQIELCKFAQNHNYNRIKCPTLGEITKIKSYEQRVTALDGAGNLASYSFNSKISGTCVFSLKKLNIIDFCPITPTTYGITTSSSLQVIDTLIHPNRQTVFKTNLSQASVALDYFNGTKLAVCRRNDLLIYDIRMEIQEENRDLAGRAKCMTSNFKDKLLVGKSEGKVRVIDVGTVGGQGDYDVKCISSGRAGEDKSWIQDIEMMGSLAVALNNQGIVSLFGLNN